MLSGIVAIGLLVLFLLCWIWAWLPGRAAEFDRAAQAPLEPDTLPIDRDTPA